MRLQSLKKRLNETGICKVPTEEIISMAEFVLKTITLSLMKNSVGKYQEQLLEINFTTLRLYFHDEIETRKTRLLQPFIWLRYTDDIFFIWTHGEQQL